MEPEVNAKGLRQIWLERVRVDKLAALRGPGESMSDVVLPRIEMEGTLGGVGRSFGLP